jgi:Flp pilus assembly protein TadB
MKDLNIKDIKKEIRSHESFKDRITLKFKEIKSNFAEKKKIKENQKRRLKKHASRNYRQFFTHYLELAGIDMQLEHLRKKFMQVGLILSIFVYLLLIMNSFLSGGFNLFYILYLTIVGIPVLFALSFVVGIILFIIYLDIMIYQRKKSIELVLPDFLQLSSANIRSGMTIDKALWFAIRPQFGVLAKEMEVVAKETMTGTELDLALHNFGEKYDSPTLKRSISLLVEGIKAGGEIGDLLDRISVDLKESQSMRKDMAADVTSYAMFITFATVVAAPFMYGLAYQLISITQTIISSIDTGTASSSGFALSVGGGGIALYDYIRFTIVNLCISSFFACAIISTITKGDIKSGMGKIPVFIIVSLLCFFFAVIVMGRLFDGMF